MFSSQSFIFTILFYLAIFALLIHLLSFVRVSLRASWFKKTDIPYQEFGVTILCAANINAKILRQSLQAAFNLNYENKEIIVCIDEQSHKDGEKLAIIRELRQQYAEIPSLVIMTEYSDNEQTFPLKCWQAARYDWVLTLANGELLPKNALDLFFNRWYNGVQISEQIAQNHQGDIVKTGLVSAPFWAMNGQNMTEQIEISFANSWQAQRLLLADSFGRGIAQDGVQFWNYDIFVEASNVKELALAAIETDDAGLAMEFVGLQKRTTCLVQEPFIEDLKQRQCFSDRKRTSIKSIFAKQANWLRLYYQHAKGLFYSELILSPILPIMAVVLLALVQNLSWGAVIGFVVLWYLIEFVLIAFLNQKLKVKESWLVQCGRGLLLPVRDCLIPFIWLYVLARRK